MAEAMPAAMIKRRRRWRILLVIVELAVLAGMFELGFRMFIPWQNYFANGGRTIRLSEHPPLEDRTLARRRSNTAPVRLRADAEGFLLPNGADPRRPVELTLAFLGGSTTESLWVSEDRRWPLVAGRTVSHALGANVRVINAGISGANLQLTINIFTNKVMQHHPDVVVVTEAWNDCGLLLARGNYNDWAVRSGGAGAGLARGAYEIATSHSASLGYLRHLWSMRQINANLRDRLDTWQASMERAVKWAPIPEAVARQYDMRLALLIGGIRAVGAEPVVLTEPAANGGTDGTATDQNWVPACAGFNDRARAVARETGVRLVDMAARITDPALFFDLMHYNDKGSEHVGEIVGRELTDLAAKRLSEREQQ